MCKTYHISDLPFRFDENLIFKNTHTFYANPFLQNNLKIRDEDIGKYVLGNSLEWSDFLYYFTPECKLCINGLDHKEYLNESFLLFDDLDDVKIIGEKFTAETTTEIIISKIELIYDIYDDELDKNAQPVLYFTPILYKNIIDNVWMNVDEKSKLISLQHANKYEKRGCSL